MEVLDGLAVEGTVTSEAEDENVHTAGIHTLSELCSPDLQGLDVDDQRSDYHLHLSSSSISLNI